MINARDVSELAAFAKSDVDSIKQETRDALLRNPEFAQECFVALVTRKPMGDMTHRMQSLITSCAMATLLQVFVEEPVKKAREILARDN